MENETWFRQALPQLRSVFESDSFAARPFIDQAAVLRSLAAREAGLGGAEPGAFRALLHLELWLRQEVGQAPAKSDYVANPGRAVPLGRRWARYPLRADPVRVGDDLATVATRRVRQFFAGRPDGVGVTPCWYLYVSEAAVAATQARGFFSWDLRPGATAHLLARFAARAPYGIGLGHPANMQLVIDEVGLPRVLLASLRSAAGRLVHRQRTTPALLPEVWEILAPPTPVWTALRTSRFVRRELTGLAAETYGGTVVIDRTATGHTVLGHDTDQPDEALAAAFADDPLGTGGGRTPFAIVVDAGYGLGSELRIDPAARHVDPVTTVAPMSALVVTSGTRPGTRPGAIRLRPPSRPTATTRWIFRIPARKIHRVVVVAGTNPDAGSIRGRGWRPRRWLRRRNPTS